MIKLNFDPFVNYIRSILEKDDIDWDKAIFYISFGQDNSHGYKFRYFKDGKKYKKVLRIFEYGPILSDIFAELESNSTDREFNKIDLEITKNDYSPTYKMVEEDVLDDLQSSALIFSHYLYEKMRIQIYEYEVANNLRKPIYDEQGIAYDYEQSWDGGLFTFVVDANTQSIQHTIELSLKGKKRILPFDLRDDYKEAILIHHELTHDKLKEFWKPWTKIEVIAPEHIIPVGKEQNYIKYY